MRGFVAPAVFSRLAKAVRYRASALENCRVSPYGGTPIHVIGVGPMALNSSHNNAPGHFSLDADQPS